MYAKTVFRNCQIIKNDNRHNDEVYQYSYENEIMKAYFQGNPQKCPIKDGLRHMAIKVKGTIPTKQ